MALIVTHPCQAGSLIPPCHLETLVGNSHLPLSPVLGSGSQRAGYLGSTTQLPKLPPLTHDIILSGSGLSTPQLDDMSTAFHPSLTSYDSHGVHSYPAASSQAARAKAAAVNELRTSQYYRDSVPPQQPQHQYEQMQHSRQQAYHQLPHHYDPQPVSAISLHRNLSISSAAQPTVTSRQSIRPATPPPSTFPSSTNPLGSEQDASEQEAESLVYHSLRIPKCVSPQGGNLADFAAQVSLLTIQV